VTPSLSEGLDSEPAAGPAHFDESALSTGELRPDWKRLKDALDAVGRDELDRRWAQGRRLLSENGVTYNVYGDPRGMDRPWQLDTIPLLLSPSEWKSIEAAIVQRASLLSAVLGDLYGPQRLLRTGALPADLIFAHPGFLRPCHGIALPGGRPLVVYSADLARSPDGRWWVIADRTQAPSGAGYALENRVVLSRILPEVFEAFHVHRLASYFRTFRESLMALAPGGKEDPHVVLLTPGPHNETYFEHAYLARYLGLPLVEGADLTVRGEKLYLKTLSGLWPIDVVLRRQDDHFCDPLELYGRSALGVAGLTQAVRAGNLTVANPLGTGLMETPAIMAFLPAICRDLLGEELAMPSAATWWCGDERAARYVTERLHELVVKPAFPGRREVIFGGELDPDGLASLRHRILAEPHRYVAQERVVLSMAPTGIGAGDEHRNLVLRVFAVATPDGGFAVMPGGLTRFSATSDSLVVSSQAGGGSKDTWVLADEPMPYVSLLERVSRPIDVSRDSYMLTSRVADNLFWLGRMSERLEGGVRLFRTALRALADHSGGASLDLQELVHLVGRMARLGRLVAESELRDVSGLESFILDAIFEEDAPGSLVHDARRLHRLTWHVRDRISEDAWRILSNMDRQLVPPETPAPVRAAATLELLDRLIVTLSAFQGLLLDSTTRGLGWRFLDLGRRLERGLHVVGLLRFGLTDDEDPGSRRLRDILAIADCTMTYRARYVTSVQAPLVVDLLLLDEANPRSLAFQLSRIEEDLNALRDAPKERLAALAARVRSAHVDEWVSTDQDDHAAIDRVRLESFLGEVTSVFFHLSDELNRLYLSHALPERQPEVMGGNRP